jgi:radical SAM-linked protein
VAQPKNQSLRIERWDYRLTFAKTGRARYISHLDMMRTMQRAFKRAGIPIWYTQGFNPHAYLMFPLALSLGTESEVEILDIALIEEWDFDKLVERLNSTMPEGLYFVKAARPIMKHTEIAYAEYEISVECSEPPERALELFKRFTEYETIEIEKRVKPKKGKKPGVKLVDIKPHINVLFAQVNGNRLNIGLKLPAGVNFNLNTGVVMDAFCDKMQIEIKNIYTKRTKISCENGEDFI